MSIQIKAPTFPESVADGTIANWIKSQSEKVNLMTMHAAKGLEFDVVF